MSEHTTKTDYDICGIGMSMIDLLQVIDEFPARGGVTESIQSQLMGGGPVPTALCTAGRLGAMVAVIDRIGDDWRGKRVAEEYGEHHVNTDQLILESGKTTTFGCVMVRRGDGERHVVFSAGDFTPLNTEELPIQTLQSCKILHLNGRHWPACVEAARIAKNCGGQVSFDGGANRYQEKFDELLALTDILIVARDFAEKFSRSEDRESQLNQLLKTGASIAAVTDGANGSWFISREQAQSFHQPAFPVAPVIDTTGCGDAFHGGFLFAHSQGYSLQRSAEFASAVAALNATALGGRGKLPTIDEVESLILGKKN